MQKLYKRDNTGAVREWDVEVHGSRYRLLSGRKGGKTTTSEWTVCTGKNIGRANETSAERQCLLEVQSLYTKKKKRGYTETLSRIDEAKEQLVGVMLAEDYNDYKHKLEFPVFSQPKLDGIRCIARPDGLWSRKGEPITTVPHIADKVVPFCKRKNLILDGELYNHVLKEDFNEIASLVRREKQSLEHAAKVRDIVQYHIYDLVDRGMCYDDRRRSLNDVIGYHFDDDKSIHLVDTLMARNQDKLDEHYEMFLEDGYEGQMVRTTDDLYQFKRTKVLLKRKEWVDGEFEIVDILEGKGNRSGMVGTVILRWKKDDTFRAALMGKNAYRRRIWQEHQKKSFAGVDATVKYKPSAKGKPRFPRVKTIDEWK